jgi:hypothetical protein
MRGGFLPANRVLRSATSGAAQAIHSRFARNPSTEHSPRMNQPHLYCRSGDIQKRADVVLARGAIVRENYHLPVWSRQQVDASTMESCNSSCSTMPEGPAARHARRTTDTSPAALPGPPVATNLDGHAGDLERPVPRRVRRQARASRFLAPRAERSARCGPGVSPGVVIAAPG